MNDNTDGTVPQDVFLAERYYYEQRKKELTILRDEFRGMYNSITAIKELFHPQITTFSSQFLQHTVSQHAPSNLLRISITDELKLSDDRKTILRNAREQELALLEKEISELHALLVVHFNELMNQVYDAYDACIKYTTEVQNGTDLWNNNKDTLTDPIASQSYEKEIMQECFLHNVQQKIAELKVIIVYYRQRKQLSSLQQSTNIIGLLDFGEQSIKEIEQGVQEQLTHVHTIMRVSEQYFARRILPTSLFKNQIKNAFHKDQSNKNAQSLKKAQDKVSSVSSGGPKKDDDDDDSEDDKKVKTADMPENEGILGHIFRNEEGHLPRTPENHKLIRDLVKDSKNYLGPDMRGNRWWGKILENGKQLWAQAYKGVVRNGGLNDVPRPYNAKTGLSKLI
jgi:hypothetical protein